MGASLLALAKSIYYFGYSRACPCLCAITRAQAAILSVFHLVIKHQLKAFNSIGKRTFSTNQRSIFNQASQTKLSKSHDREKRSFTQLNSQNYGDNLTSAYYHFKSKTRTKKIYFRKVQFIFTARKSWNDTEFLQSSFYTHCTKC